ncbi:E3 ubiquitin protein ligase RFI2-like protein isoform X1, partial [Tanacetum coccineum]
MGITQSRLGFGNCGVWMGLEDGDVVDDDGGKGGGDAVLGSVSCSICLDVVTDTGDRSWAKLQCGHQFHL